MLTFSGESQLCTNHSGFQDIPAIVAHSAIAFSAMNTNFYPASMIARASHQPNTAWGACYMYIQQDVKAVKVTSLCKASRSSQGACYPYLLRIHSHTVMQTNGRDIFCVSQITSETFLMPISAYRMLIIIN